MNNKAKSDGRSQTLGMVQVALFAALIIIMAFTPFLGYIPLGFTRATIIHVPVIIGSILLGPKKGAVLGGIFGLTSFINNTMNRLCLHRFIHSVRCRGGSEVLLSVLSHVF